jgi:hypothetical protein
VDPRTFLPPRRLTVSPAPAVGDPAPALPTELQPGQPAVVAFLRHTGCPFAEATLHQLRDAAESSPDTDWIAVSHADRSATDRWLAAVGGPGRVRVVSDPSRKTYAGWGLATTSLGHFLGRQSLGAVAKLARQGIRNRHPTGTRWQSAGTFALDPDGTIRWRHTPEHAGDLPDLSAAQSAVR